MKQRKDITGQRFGSLVAVRFTHKILSSGRKMSAWVLRCDCGTEVTAMTTNLMAGKHRSCGCEQIERSLKSRGVTGVSKRPEYRIYRQMIDRCYLSTAPNFKWYGGRGISVCDRWRFGTKDQTGFECFFADMGERPDGLTLDREDFDGGYCPENCRWVDWQTQANNKASNYSITVKGETRTLSEWAKICGAFPSTIKDRIKRGWPVDVAVTTPPLKTWNRHEGHNYRP